MCAYFMIFGRVCTHMYALVCALVCPLCVCAQIAAIEAGDMLAAFDQWDQMLNGDV